jgi:hypothetical protein
MKALTRLAVIDGFSLIAGSSLLQYWIVKTDWRLPVPESLSVTLLLGWVLLLCGSIAAQKRNDGILKFAGVALLIGFVATILGSMRVGAVY